MDSCHIFNFLFGTRKAASEFSKCFSTTLDQQNEHEKSKHPSSSRKSTIVSTCDQDGTNISTATAAADCNPQQQPPSSPLKQIQQKLANLNLTTKFKLNAEPRSTTQKAATSKAQQELVSEDYGTYRRKIETPPPLVGSRKLILEQPTLKSKHEVVVIENPNCSLVDSRDENNSDVQRIASCSADDASKEMNVIGTQSQLENVEAGKVRAELCRVDCGRNDDDDDFYYAIDQADSKQIQDSLHCAVLSTTVDDNNELQQQQQQQERNEQIQKSTATTTIDNGRQLFKDKKSERVRQLVQSFELSSSAFSSTEQANDGQQQTTAIQPSSIIPPTVADQNNNYRQDEFGPTKRCTATTTFIRNNSLPQQQQILALLNRSAKPPKTPPKSVRAKCFNFQLNLRKPTRVEQLFQDEQFLSHLFVYFEPLDRCSAAQVCRSWRKTLYSKQSYWKDLINVIDCTQLRREHLIECIMSTLHQSAKLKQQQKQQQLQLQQQQQQGTNQAIDQRQQQQQTATIDQDEIWRIQELCNRYSRNSSSTQSFNLIRSLNNNNNNGNGNEYSPPANNNNNHQNQHQVSQQTDNNYQQQQQQQPANYNYNSTSKSSSIPSQISSSTLSSVSISSLLSPLSESSRVDSLREKLYNSIDDRGFDAICLFGATDEDIEDLARRTPPGAHKRILVGRLNNCCISDRGLELFLSTFSQLEELELSGCNEISNSIDLRQLINLEKLIITDCTNIADGFAQKLVPIFHQLSELTIQSYHLTDSFLDYVSLNSDHTNKLRRLELPNCKEITNQTMLTIAKHFPNVESLSISGSTKIGDDGIELLTEQAKQLRCIDLSWCTKITDASLECIACDLSTSSLSSLILDRNVHITDIGLGYLSTMANLELVHIRWCSRITDLGLESLFTLKSLKYLSLAGLNQITARSLLCLIEVESLIEVELTNCSAVNGELLRFLRDKMPKCNIIY